MLNPYFGAMDCNLIILTEQLLAIFYNSCWFKVFRVLWTENYSISGSSLTKLKSSVFFCMIFNLFSSFCKIVCTVYENDSIYFSNTFLQWLVPLFKTGIWFLFVLLFNFTENFFKSESTSRTGKSWIMYNNF